MNLFKTKTLLTAGLGLIGLSLGGSLLQAESLSLQQAIDQALENNYTLRQAREQIEQQNGVLLEARSGRLPTAALEGSYSIAESDALDLAGYTDKNWSVGVSVSQILYSGGSVSAGIRSAEFQQEAAIQSYRAIVNDTLFGVEQQFFTVLLYQEQLRVQEASLKLLEEILTDTRIRQEAGTATSFEVLRAEVNVANARTPVIRAGNNLLTAKQQLLRILGSEQDHGTKADELELLGTLEQEKNSFSVNALLDQALSQRPELKQYQASLNRADAGIDQMRAGYRPSVSAFASASTQNSNYTSNWSKRLDGLTAGVQFQWNLFDGNATKARVHQARAQLRQAKWALEDIRQEIETGLLSDYASYQEALALLDASGQVVGQAEESLRLARARYDAGTGTQLDINDAEVALTQARSNRAEAAYAHATASARLRRDIADRVYSVPQQEFTK